MEDALGSHLEELETLIQGARADGKISDEERAEIAALLERVRDDIAAAEPDHEGLADQLESLAVRFESDHPTVSSVIRSAVQTLTGYGI